MFSPLGIPPPAPPPPVRTIRRDVELCFGAPQLEKLTLAVERLQGSGVATRGTFLVLTRTLLLSLGDPDEAEHLRTCQRVYALLEPRLLEVVRNDGELVGPTETHRMSFYFSFNRASYRANPGVVCVQQGDLQASIPSSFSDGLTAYLGHGDAGYSSVLLCLLRDFISSLRCRDASCKGKNAKALSGERKQRVELRTRAA